MYCNFSLDRRPDLGGLGAKTTVLHLGRVVAQAAKYLVVCLHPRAKVPAYEPPWRRPGWIRLLACDGACG